MDGSLNGNQSPSIKIEMFGTFGLPIDPIFYDAVVDTGFTGGISVPITIALPLGLTLFSTASFTLADGSTSNTYLCFGRVKLDNQIRPIVFSLSQGRDILVGTEFLQAFNSKLELNYNENKFTLISQVKPEIKPLIEVETKKDDGKLENPKLPEEAQKIRPVRITRPIIKKIEE